METVVLIVLATAIYFNIGCLYVYVSRKEKYPRALKFLFEATNGGKLVDTDSKLDAIMSIIFWVMVIFVAVLVWLVWLIFGGFVRIFTKNNILE